MNDGSPSADSLELPRLRAQVSSEGELERDPAGYDTTTKNDFSEISVSTQAPAPSDAKELAAENQQLRIALEKARTEIDHWKMVEIEWSRLRRLYKAICENVSDLIVVLDRQGNRIWSNPAYEHVLGYPSTEISGTHVLTEVHPDDRGVATEAMNEAMSTASAQQAEYRVQKKDGTWADLQTEVLSISAENGTAESFLLLAHDATELKTLHDAVAQSKDATTAASMAEGIARDFDQILVNIMGNLTIARNLNGPHNAVAVRLNEMERALKRAQDLTEQMLSMSSSPEQKRESVAIEPIIQEAVAAVLRGTMVRAEYVFPRHLPDLEVDVEAFSHALRNVVTNSIQAMDKGVIRLTSETITQEQFASRPDIPLNPGNYMGIYIQDQGHGMTERIAERAFEPYFTTRQGSQGLGLTTALSSIQRQGGTIQLSSTPGVGTAVSIYLPMPATVPAKAKSLTSRLPVVHSPVGSSESGRPGHGTGARILLMDDEQMILDIVSRMLIHLGYVVKTCTDGAQAIAVFAKAKNDNEMFDVVLMDLLVPNGVGGQDAIHTIRKIHPTAKVIASSGHLDHPVMLDYKKFGFTAALEKPYKIEKLQQTIEAVVSGPAA